jgi:hypothetical protein
MRHELAVEPLTAPHDGHFQKPVASGSAAAAGSRPCDTWAAPLIPEMVVAIAPAG